ncbi:MAG TPA: hypothetical protein VN894_04135 [Polyangiaceae bacterium]|nr:hypothetical protein [Polyangiaceae bacterium]
MTDPQAPIDPHGLLTGGEELATEAELARLLGVSRAVLGPLLRGAMHGLVRFVDAKPAPRRFSVADARGAIAPHMPALEAQKRQAAERQEAEQAAAKARREAKAAAHAVHVANKRRPLPQSRAVERSEPKSKSRPEPEVFVRRRPGG